MDTNQRWFITGCSRGLGLEIAKAALAAGHSVTATARNFSDLKEHWGGDPERLLLVKLDVTDPVQVEDAVHATVDRFGGIDVLVNNAGYGQLGFFEENSLADARAQLETNLIGVLNMTWAVLPEMRRAKAGRIFNMSSTAGLRGNATGSIYSASKFAVEGFSEALASEVEPLGVHVTIVEPGLFRTDFLNASSVRFGETHIADYAAQSADLQAKYRGMAGLQNGNPGKLAQVIVQLAREAKPPLRLAAGSDAVATVEAKIQTLRLDLDKWRELSVSTDGF